MYYSNLMGNVSGTFNRNGGKSFPLIIESSEKVSNQSVRVHDGKILVTSDLVGEDVFALRGERDFTPTPFKGVSNLTIRELADTEENPLIVVCTKGIRFYSDIPTYLNVLFVNDDFMIAMLIYGACEFEFEDGSFVPLQRCDETDLNKKGIHSTFSCKSLKERIYNRTKGGWDKSYEMICPLLVRAKTNGDISTRCMPENAYVFNESAIKNKEEEEVRKAEEARIAEENKKKEAEDRRRRAAEEAQRRRDAEFRKRQEELAQKAAKKRERQQKSGKKSTTSVNGRSAGAEAFLAFINGNK